MKVLDTTSVKCGIYQKNLCNFLNSLLITVMMFFIVGKVRGVINLCEEYRGPDRSYWRLGMLHLRLPTTDHFEPTVEDLEKAVHFISDHKTLGKKVYVHCRAGHGRSAAVVFAWLLSQNPDANLEDLNRELCKLRDVRKNLWKQRNIIRYHSRLRNSENTTAKANVVDGKEL